MAELDVATLHEAIAAELADEPCIIADTSLSWREVTDRTRSLAAVLAAHGLGRHRPASDTPAWETGQDHLGVLLHNRPEYLEAVLGAHKASVAPFNINYRYTGEELTYLLRDARPAALVYGARFAGLLAEVLPRLDTRPLLLQVADIENQPPLGGALEYEAALAAADPGEQPLRPEADDRHLLYTGGTTGMPKGVIWRAGDMVAGPYGVRSRDGSPIESIDDAVRKALSIRGRVLPAPPFMHGAGIGFAFGGWLSGATVVIPPHVERFDAAALLDVCAAERVTSMAIVGDAFGAPLAEELQQQPRELPELRLIVNSGAALGESVKGQLRALLPQLRISDMLGSSETGLHARRSAGSNRFSSKGSAAVLDESRSRLLAPGEDAIGWLAQGGHIPMGYLGDARKTATTFVTIDGQRYSVPGERARLLADGTIEFLGREATTINTGGEKVFADEVENVIRALPGVADAVVVGRPSERWGQEVVSLYQPSATAPVSAEELAESCRAHLAGYKVPKTFIRVDQVRRHANGKTDYGWAKATAAEPQREREET